MDRSLFLDTNMVEVEMFGVRTSKESSVCGESGISVMRLPNAFKSKQLAFEEDAFSLKVQGIKSNYNLIFLIPFHFLPSTHIFLVLCLPSEFF